MSGYALIRPCPTCPFRTDIQPYLRKDRVREIEQSLVLGEFYCHETTVEDEEYESGESDRYYPRGGEEHCAGALILLEKLERSSQMMRIAERIGIYDRTKLDMTAPVFPTFQAMIRKQLK